VAPVLETRVRVRDSVFAKLVAIMISLAVTLILMVSLFFWVVLTRDLHSMIRKDIAHDGLLLMLVIVILAIVVVAHAFLRHLLRPLRELSDAVARVGDGAFDVQVPHRTGDEFGALADAFNSMVGKVRAMIGSRDQLLIDVSHELRSPLTRMKVALELLPADQQRARLSDDVAEMERMVTELLELERLRAGRGLQLERIEILPLVAEAVSRHRGSQPEIRVSSISTQVVATVDAQKVRTVLRNLLDNALKHSLPDSGPIEVSVVEGPTALEVRVTDDGIGVPASELERLFEPFYRVDRSRSKETGGYGLGLSMCKRIMEAHGGSVAAEALRPRGCRFTLTFPKPG
jgi:signal transduction histidine kinase